MPASRPYHHGDLRAALLQSAERRPCSTPWRWRGTSGWTAP
ncbi:hypothetical protein [Streptomyces sp. S816]|nr:hypothetical protein [Streptomyces sp. S816]